MIVGRPDTWRPSRSGARSRRADRSLRARRHPVRDALGPASLRGNDRGRGALRDPSRAAAGPLGIARGRGDRSRPPPGAFEETRGPAPLRPSSRFGARRRPALRKRGRGAGPNPHPARRSSLPHAPARSRHRLSLSRSRGRRQRFALEPALAGRALERGRGALLDGRARLETNRRRGRRGPRAHGHVVAVGRPTAGRGPAGRSPRRELFSARITVEAAVGDVFDLQDELSRRIVDSLALPLQGRADEP